MADADRRARRAAPAGVGDGRRTATTSRALLRPGGCVLIDGLGTWIAGVMHRSAAAQPLVREEVAALARAAAAAPDPVIVVAEQAGEGLLPADALSRAWLDLLGEATQALSRARRARGARRRPAARSSCRQASPAPPPADVAGPAPARRHARAPGRRRPRRQRARRRPAAVAARRRSTRALEEDVSALSARGRDASPRSPRCTAATPQEIVPTNGAAQALWLLPAALRPRLAACVHPGFTETEAALRAHGDPRRARLRDARATTSRSIPPRSRTAPTSSIVGNPASPSGTLDPLELVLALRRPGRVVVVDEAFMDLVPGETASLVREALPDVIVVRSMTKSLAIPGLRAGYAVAPEPLADRLRAVRPPWSCNALALAALQAMAQRPEALDAAAARAQAERRDLERRLAQIPGLRTWPAAANYVLVRVQRRRGGHAAAARRGDRGAPGRLVPRPDRRRPADHRARAARQRAPRGRAGGGGRGAMITVVGIGADGWESLSPEARAAVLAADLLVGGERQLDLVAAQTAARAAGMAEEPRDARRRAARARRRRALGRRARQRRPAAARRRRDDPAPPRRRSGVRVIPAVSSYALACARLRWPRSDVELVSATSRIAEVVAPALQPGRRLVVLGFGPRTAAEVARVARDARVRRQPPRRARGARRRRRADRRVDRRRLGRRRRRRRCTSSRSRSAATGRCSAARPGLPDDALRARRPDHQARRARADARGARAGAGRAAVGHRRRQRVGRDRVDARGAGRARDRDRARRASGRRGSSATRWRSACRRCASCTARRPRRSTSSASGRTRSSSAAACRATGCSMRCMGGAARRAAGSSPTSSRSRGRRSSRAPTPSTAAACMRAGDRARRAARRASPAGAPRCRSRSTSCACR